MKHSDEHKQAVNYIYQRPLYPDVEVERAKAEIGDLVPPHPKSQPKPAIKPKLIRRQGTLL